VALLSSSGEAALALVFRLTFSCMFLCFMSLVTFLSEPLSEPFVFQKPEALQQAAAAGSPESGTREAGGRRQREAGRTSGHST
jgi:hypothetical protein